MKKIIVIIIPLFLFNCSENKKAVKETENIVIEDKMLENKIPEYILMYADLNNNTYYITEKKVVYDPMTPLESSSGEYSGGEQWEKDISHDTYLEIERLFDKLINNTNGHLEKRERISILIKTKKSKYILKPNKELDSYLKSLKD